MIASLAAIALAAANDFARGRARFYGNLPSMKILIPVVAALLAVSSPSAFGKGSLPTEEVLAILKKEPKLHAHFTSAFTFQPVAIALRLGSSWPHLGGLRIAPYTLRASAKDEKNTQFRVIVHCSQTFLDAQGKVLMTHDSTQNDGEPTEEIFANTMKVVEKVISVSVRLPSPEDDE